MDSLYKYISRCSENGQKLFAWLIDPDKYTTETLTQRLVIAQKANVDLIFVGGSLITRNSISETILLIKKYLKIPVIIFPGNSLQITENADAILYLSMISGRNPDYLIGRHIETAMTLKRSKLEVIPTGYMLINTGAPTSVSYMSHTTPIPYDKNEIAMSIATAGELLGLKLIFLEGGSGAEKPVSCPMIKAVKKSIDIPLVVGGGITGINQLENILEAGADIVVAGNGVELNSNLLMEFSNVFNAYNLKKRHHQS